MCVHRHDSAVHHHHNNIDNSHAPRVHFTRAHTNTVRAESNNGPCACVCVCVCVHLVRIHEACKRAGKYLELGTYACFVDAARRHWRALYYITYVIYHVVYMQMG